MTPVLPLKTNRKVSSVKDMHVSLSQYPMSVLFDTLSVSV